MASGKLLAAVFSPCNECVLRFVRRRLQPASRGVLCPHRELAAYLVSHLSQGGLIPEHCHSHSLSSLDTLLPWCDVCLPGCVRVWWVVKVLWVVRVWWLIMMWGDSGGLL